jgi:hypothetical protein
VVPQIAQQQLVGAAADGGVQVQVAVGHDAQQRLLLHRWQRHAAAGPHAQLLHAVRRQVLPRQQARVLRRSEAAAAAAVAAGAAGGRCVCAGSARLLLLLLAPCGCGRGRRAGAARR